jgi:hypothetical protein
MRRDLIWHVRAIAWITVLVGVAMVATNIETAGQVVAGVGLVLVLVTQFRPRPAQQALPPVSERPSGASDTP